MRDKPDNSIADTSNPAPMNARQLRFYSSVPHSCGYLPGNEAVSVFADPQEKMTAGTYSRLIDMGFRRSGDYVYRPHCPTCHACLPARVVVEGFKRNRSQERTWQRNSDLSTHSREAKFNEEHFELYMRYIKHRHAGGGMDTTDPTRYESFLLSRWCNTELIEFRHQDRLVAVAVTDVVQHGLSAFYTFFDPTETPRGLGVYAVLWQINETRQRGLPWLYLGYLIKDCRKMSYKQRYKPLQVLRNSVWQPLDPA